MSSRKRRIFANPRILILLSAALLVLGLFVLRLWDLQIVRGAEYRNRAVNNRLREEAICRAARHHLRSHRPAPRRQCAQL